MRQQRIRERIAALMAKETRETFQSLAISRELMGLLVGHHLQPMLD
jgi:hypothetical protein